MQAKTAEKHTAHHKYNGWNRRLGIDLKCWPGSGILSAPARLPERSDANTLAHCGVSRFSCIFPTTLLTRTDAHVLRSFCRMRRALAQQRRARTPAPRPPRELYLR